MAQRLRNLYGAYREEISYLFFGVCTSAVNYGVFVWLDILWKGRGVLASNLIAFAAAVAFAYVTNKIFVFRSRDWSPAALRREVSAFVGARLFSFGLEELGMFLAAYVWHLGERTFLGVDGLWIAKLVLSILATVLNYFFSKFWIFRNRPQTETRRERGGRRG